MKYAVLSLLYVSLIFATVFEDTTEYLGIEIEADSFTGGGELLDDPEVIQYKAPPEPLDPETLADINDPSSGAEYQSPVERAISRGDEGSSIWPDYDWWDDIIVYPGRVGSGQDFDVDWYTGDVYAIFDTDHATLDSLIVYRSQDSGETWSIFAFGTNTDGSISNPKIRVANDSSGDPWVVAMGIWNETGDDILWTRRCTTSGGSSTWEQVAADVGFADMDADIGMAACVYATYVEDGTDYLRAAGNLLGGSGWVNDVNIFYGTGVTPYPAIAAGLYGNVSIAFITDYYTSTPQVRIKSSTNSGINWTASEQVSNTDSPSLEDCDIAFTHGPPEQTGWITVTYNFTSSDDFGYYYSTNSGSSWTFGNMFAGSGGDENHGSIRVNKGGSSSGSLSLAYNVDPGDSVMFSTAYSLYPTNFNTPMRINDFNATSSWPACAGWSGGYPSILYTNFSVNYRLMFDGYFNVGINNASERLGDMIQNAPNPFSATTNISFNLTQSSPITISIYNITGQLVSTLADNQSFDEGSHSVQWDGQNESGTRVSSGVYFCHLSANGISRIQRMLMIR